MTSNAEGGFHQRYFRNFVQPSVRREFPPDIASTANPINFLDRHIDEKLVLKRVHRLPGLISELDLMGRSYLESSGILSHPDHFFGVPVELYTQTSALEDASDIARFYSHGFPRTCARMVSSHTLHPDRSDARGGIFWDPSDFETCSRDVDNAYLVQTYTLRLKDYLLSSLRYELDSFSDETRHRLLSILSLSRHLAVAMFFSPVAHGTMEDINKLADLDSFHWTQNTTVEHPAPPLYSPPEDAPVPPWSIPSLDPIEWHSSVRRNKRVKLTLTTSKDYYAPGKIQRLEPDEVPGLEAASYVQRAWANAVRTDTSVIVFDCGNYAQIGIRHRASQTLFLSDVVDVCSLEAPGYSFLMLGLHVAIVRDVLQRLPFIEARALLRSKQLKDDASRIPKTLKVASLRRPRPAAKNKKSPTVVKDELTITKELQETTADRFRRPFLAIYIRTSIYNSPSPSVLLAPGTTDLSQYGVTKYVAVILERRLGTGATGSVFSATLLAPKKHAPIIVKVATTFDALCRLRHEYSIYRHLSAKGVVGIPRVYGYYQDAQQNAGALILGHMGSPLAKRRGRDGKVVVTMTERTSATALLSAIHAAGVLHRDIRTWNILATESGELSIIDFDRASWHAYSREYEAEKERMQQLLDGDFVDDDSVIGEDSYDSNIARIVRNNVAT